MAMYRFEIYSKKNEDKVTHYYWRLISSSEDQEDTVVQSRGFHSRAEAEDDAWVFRRGVRRARIEDPVTGSHHGGTFRRVPNVATLRVISPEWHTAHEAEHNREARAGHEPEARPRREAETKPGRTRPGRAAARTSRPARPSASRAPGRSRAGRAT